MPLRNYPLATPEGDWIPIDVLEPISKLEPIAITTSAMGASVAIPFYEERVLEIRSTVDCEIGFNVSPVNGTSEKGTYFLFAGEPKLIFPIGGQVSALALSTSGTLYVNILNLWEATKKDYQTDISE